jgi:hypothetical protein
VKELTAGQWYALDEYLAPYALGKKEPAFTAEIIKGVLDVAHATGAIDAPFEAMTGRQANQVYGEVMDAYRECSNLPKV